jgi:beta-glucanase (GH16 family)
VVLGILVPAGVLAAGSAARARPLPAPVPYVKDVVSAVGVSSPCGLLPPLPRPSTGGQWTCTFADEFNGGVLDRTKWAVQRTDLSGFHSGSECFRDDPHNVEVADGTLQLTVRKEPVPFTCTTPSGGYATQYTSGSVSTYQLFSQAYGRFEVRAKVPAVRVRGLQESFWLWPDNPLRYGPWPGSGEIDIAEIYSLYNNLAIPYIHYIPAAYDPNVTATNCSIGVLPAFHTYVAEWTTDSITISIDGRTCLVDRWNPASPLVKPQPFDQPFMVALTQALGIGANAFAPGVTPLPATTQIDYVRVYK